MRRLLQPLRVRLAIAGFVATYMPVLVLVIVTFTAESLEESTVQGVEVSKSGSSSVNWGIVLATAGLTAPIAAALSWWWAGRAIRPISEAIVIQEQLIEETSHELRTPLAILTNNAEVLLGHPEPALDDYRKGLARSLTTARDMTKTIDALLVDARGRARSVVLDPTDLTQLTASVINTMNAVAAEANVALAFDPGTVEYGRVDAASVERALRNLIANAITASPPGSVVTIALHPSQEMIEMSVTDQGPGITEDEQDLVFDRYWHSSVNGAHGSGIGLDIVKQVAQAHGGAATLESSPAAGSGSRFGFSITR